MAYQLMEPTCCKNWWTGFVSGIPIYYFTFTDHDDEYVWDVGGNSMQTYSTKLVSDALCQSSLHVAWDRITAYWGIVLLASGMTFQLCLLPWCKLWISSDLWVVLLHCSTPTFTLFISLPVWWDLPWKLRCSIIWVA